LSSARNRAIAECTSDILIFTDDDVKVSTTWLIEFIHAARSFPDASYFGGRILPYWSNSRPGWLRDESMALISGLLLHYDLGEDNRPYTIRDPLPYGASFAIHRNLFEITESFREDLGVSGTIPGRGEEAEYLNRAANHGFSGVYVGKAVCYHRVDPQRLNLKYMYAYGIQKGIAESLINKKEKLKGSRLVELMYAVKGIVQLTKGRGDRFRQCVINMGIQHGLRETAEKR
jgi:GT2 family glycosyltransferase